MASMIRDGTYPYLPIWAYFPEDLRPVNRDITTPHGRYLAPAGALYIPFTLLPFSVALFLWRILNATALGITTYLLMRALWGRWSWEWLGLTCLILLSSRLIKSQLESGHVNILFLCGLAAVWLAHHHDRPWLAGAFIGVSAIFKPMPLMLVPLFLIKRQYRTVISTLLTILGLIVFSLLLIGVEGNVHTLVTIKSYHNWVLFKDFQISAISLVYKLLGGAYPLLAYGLGAGTMVALYIVSLFICARRDGPLSVGEYALVVSLVPICSPYVRLGHFLLLAFPLLIAAYLLMRDEPLQGLSWGVFMVIWLAWAWVESFLSLNMYIEGHILIKNLLHYVPLFTAIALWGLLLSRIVPRPSKRIMVD